MRKGLLLWIMVMISLLQTGSAKTIYVKNGSNGNGLSWENAFGDLQKALKAAKKGDEIWVAAGIYVPTYDGNRSVSFSLVEEVSMFGGFAGFETKVSQRDFTVNQTILSGEIGTAAKEDNSFTVVYAEKITRTTVIDGFIISDGHANGTENDVHRNTCGAAWFNFNSSPTITNCVFKENLARYGGAMYNYSGKGGNSSPMVKTCNFLDNQADLDGGCIYNNGDEGTCMPRFEACVFNNNIATYGAGMMNRAKYGKTMVTILGSKFISNKTLMRGPAIYNHRDKSGICQATTQDCTFEENYASVGKEISNTMNNGLSTGGN